MSRGAFRKFVKIFRDLYLTIMQLIVNFNILLWSDWLRRVQLFLNCTLLRSTIILCASTAFLLVMFINNVQGFTNSTVESCYHFLKIPLFKHSNVLFLIFECFIVHLIINFTPMFEWNQFKTKQQQQQNNK